MILHIIILLWHVEIEIILFVLLCGCILFCVVAFPLRYHFLHFRFPLTFNIQFAKGYLKYT